MCKSAPRVRSFPNADSAPAPDTSSVDQTNEVLSKTKLSSLYKYETCSTPRSTSTSGRLYAWRAKNMQSGPVSRYKHAMPWEATTDAGKKLAKGSSSNPSSPRRAPLSRPKSASSQSSIFVGGLPKTIHLDYTKMLIQGPRLPETISEVHGMAPSGDLDASKIATVVPRKTRPHSAPATRSSSVPVVCHYVKPGYAEQALPNGTLHAHEGNRSLLDSCERPDHVARENLASNGCKQEMDVKPKMRPSSAGVARATTPFAQSRQRPKSAGASRHSQYKVEEMDPDYIWDILRTKPATLHSTLNGSEQKKRQVAAKNNAMAW